MGSKELFAWAPKSYSIGLQKSCWIGRPEFWSWRRLVGGEVRSTTVFAAGATQSGAEAGLKRQLRRGVERSGTERRSWRCNPAGAERRVAPAPKTAVRSTGAEDKRRKRQSQTSPAPGQKSEAPNGGRPHPTALGSTHFRTGAAWFGRRAEPESQWSCVVEPGDNYRLVYF